VQLLQSPIGRKTKLIGSPLRQSLQQSIATNPYAADAPKLYDQQGNYRGKLSANPYDPDSTSNPSAATALHSHQTRLRIPTAPRVPIAPAVPRIPTAAVSELKGADAAAELRHVSSQLLDTSVLHCSSRFCCRSHTRQEPTG